MKCIHCGSEWNSIQTTGRISFCPFCGKSLEPEAGGDSMEEILRSILKQFGPELFRNGKQLMGIVSDLAPNHQREKRLLGYLVGSGGQILLLDSLQKSQGEQSVAVSRVARKLYEEWMIRKDAVCEICEIYWKAIGGDPEALQSVKQTMKERGEKAAEASAAAKKQPEITKQPESTVPKVKNPPEHFRISGNKLEKYTGSDAVVRIPDGVGIIGRKAFSTNQTLQEVIIPEGVVELEDDVFTSCYNLRKVWLPNSLKVIGRHVFSYCYKLEYADLPRDLTGMGINVFCSCSALQEIVVPGGIRKVGSWTFENCGSLQRVVLQPGITTLDSRCFRNCKALKTLEVPDSLTSISLSSFVGCSGIQVQASESWKKAHPDLLARIP